jgi:hypothetical protein
MIKKHFYVFGKNKKSSIFAPPSGVDAEIAQLRKITNLKLQSDSCDLYNFSRVLENLEKQSF